jgi:hypothetical protein
MKDTLYYRITTGIAWVMIVLGLLECALWTLGVYPNWTWQRLAEPILWGNILLLIHIIRQRDEMLDEVQQKNQKLIDHIDELNHRIEDRANRINE